MDVYICMYNQINNSLSTAACCSRRTASAFTASYIYLCTVPAIYMCGSSYTCVCVCIYIYTYTYTYTYICMDVYICMYNQINNFLSTAACCSRRNASTSAASYIYLYIVPAIYMCGSSYTCVCVYIYTYIHIHIYIYIYIYIVPAIYMCGSSYTCVCVYIYTYIHIHIYIYIYICMDVYKCMYTQINTFPTAACCSRRKASTSAASYICLYIVQAIHNCEFIYIRIYTIYIHLYMYIYICIQ